MMMMMMMMMMIALLASNVEVDCRDSSDLIPLGCHAGKVL